MDDKSRSDLFFNRVTIVGVGLLGASFAFALKEKGLCSTIIGTGRREENLKRAKEKGIIDDFNLDANEACRDSNLILLSTPVGAFKDITEKIKKDIKKNAIITDVGSVKGRLVYELESIVSDKAFYIGSHPIAGSDKSGIDDAKADLFKSALCIITPTENSDEEALSKITTLWERLGARIKLMDPYKHDEVYAAVSHLPHIIAYTLVNTIGDIDSDFIEYAGQGFKDTTRIALSSPELWSDIVIYNKDNLLKLLEIYREKINDIKRLLEKADAEGITEEFTKAQELRKRLK